MAPNIVVLVHGIFDTGASFKRVAQALAHKGYDCRCPTLAPADGRLGLEALARQLQAYIDAELPAAARFSLVGFSMGGLVARHYLQRLGGLERAERFVSVSSPHHGSRWAHALDRPACVQMRPGSAYLAQLNADLGRLGAIETVSVWSPFDLAIVPAWSSRLPVGREIVVRVPLHPWMLVWKNSVGVIKGLFP